MTNRVYRTGPSNCPLQKKICICDLTLELEIRQVSERGGLTS